MGWIEQRFVGYETTFAALELIGAFFLVLIVSETLWDLITRQRGNARETLANFAIGIVNLLLERTAFGLVFVLGLFWAQSLTSQKISLTWWSWALAALAADFTYYWMHRWEHEVRILWALHSVHHSSPEYNLTTSLRLAWIEGLVEWLFFVPMVLIGFDAVQVIAAMSQRRAIGGMLRAMCLVAPAGGPTAERDACHQCPPALSTARHDHAQPPPPQLLRTPQGEVPEVEP